MRQSFSISFVCRASKANKQGLAAVECSVSVNSTRVVFALPRKEKPDVFKRLMASNRNSDLKKFTATVYNKLQECVTNLMTQNVELSAQAIKDAYFNEDKIYTLADAFNDFMIFQRQRTAADATLTTYAKYRLATQWYTKHFDCSIAIDSLKVGDLHALRGELLKEYKQQTVNSYLSRLRSVYIWASNNGKCTTNPFAQFKLVKPKNDITYLTLNELKILEDKVLHTDRLDNVRDLFLFQCYTALSYSDMAQLTEADIQYDNQNRPYIQKQRQKTSVTYTIPLLPKAIAILAKYDYKLPCLSNQKYNSYLKEIADLCGITKNLHTHLGRHTFATVALNAGIPIEIVSKVLGHSSIKMTQTCYAKLLDSTIISKVLEHLG